MTTAWKDVTSYSSDDKERVPRTWEQRVGPLRVCVTRKFYADGWFLHCDELGIVGKRLEGELEAAKREAVARVQERAKVYLEAAMRLQP